MRTDGFRGDRRLLKVGIQHERVVRGSDPARSTEILPWVHRVFGHLETWLRGTFHAVSGKHLPRDLAEFSYEDLGFAFLVERSRGLVEELEEDGRRLLRLESPLYHFYSRVVTRVDPATALPVQVSFFDRAGQKFREEFYDQVQEISGHPFPTRIRTRDLLTGAESTLRFRDLKIDVPVPASVFEESEISRRLGRRPSPPAG